MQVPPSREIELVSGAIDLQLNDDFDAGLWRASGLLAGLPRTGDGQIWRGGDLVFVDPDFVISLEVPLGDSVFKPAGGGPDAHAQGGLVLKLLRSRHPHTQCEEFLRTDWCHCAPLHQLSPVAKRCRRSEFDNITCSVRPRREVAR